MKKMFRGLGLACAAFALLAGCKQNEDAEEDIETSQTPIVSEAEATEEVDSITLSDGNWTAKIVTKTTSEKYGSSTSINYMEFTVAADGTVTVTKASELEESDIPDGMSEEQINAAIEKAKEYGYTVSREGNKVTTKAEASAADLEKMSGVTKDDAIKEFIEEGATIKANSDKTKYLATWEESDSNEGYSSSTTASLAKN